MKNIPELDTGFVPISKFFDAYQENVAKVGGVPLTIAVERNKGYISTYSLDVFADGTGHDEENYGIIEKVSFIGSVIGATNVGGIAGVNKLSGSITGCLAAGEIIGEGFKPFEK